MKKLLILVAVLFGFLMNSCKKDKVQPTLIVRDTIIIKDTTQIEDTSLNYLKYNWQLKKISVWNNYRYDITNFVYNSNISDSCWKYIYPATLDTVNYYSDKYEFKNGNINRIWMQYNPRVPQLQNKFYVYKNYQIRGLNNQLWVTIEKTNSVPLIQFIGYLKKINDNEILLMAQSADYIIWSYDATRIYEPTDFIYDYCTQKGYHYTFKKSI